MDQMKSMLRRRKMGVAGGRVASRAGLNVERLERRRVLAGAVPTATMTVPPQALIGTTLNFTVGFANASSSQTGYGPYVDLELPTAGAGGNNGITFGSASYLGAAVTSTVLTFDAAGHATHPYAKTSTGAPVVVTGTPGDQLVVLQLPFGSFTPGQPEADLSVAANLSNYAAVGSALNIKADGGFRYGNDALDNPTADPSLIGASTTSPVTPTLVTVKATYLGPEQETATGPDFPEQYLITATVAPGQTISNFSLSDVLPNNLQFVSLDSSAANGSTSAATTSAPSTTAPGGTLTRRFDKVVGTGGAADASMKFTFHAPRDDSAGQPVLNLATGAFATATDQAQATGTWTPLNPAQATQAVASNTAVDAITAKSVAVQQGVVDLTHPGALQPGDVLQYALNFQLSDFFAVQNALASELISDGQHFDATFTPTFSFTSHGATTASAGLAAADYVVGAQDTTSGATPIAFRISPELIARAFNDGRLLGGSIPAGGTGGASPPATPLYGATTGTIVFRTVVQQRFDYNYPSGEPYLDQGDQLTSSVTLGGDVLSYANLSADGSAVADTSGTAVQIGRGALSTSIYAINGVTGVGPTPKVAAGDVVTYRIQYTLPNSNVEQLSLTGFPPLPVFDATTLSTFDDATGAAAPAVGHAKFGPADTYRALSGIVPTLSSDETANSVTFSYGTYHDPGQTTSTIDILYSVRVGSQPFADGLFLTNQAHETEGSTNQGSTTANALTQINLTEPVLSITKGIVAIDNPNGTVTANPYGFSAPGTAGYRASGTINSNGVEATPITGTATKLDAGDRATFAVVVENTGSGLNGAYDLTLKDVLPAGFVVPASGLNLSVTDGTGAALSVANVGGGSGLFDQGIVVTNPNAALGTLAAYDPTSGRNILIITYDLQAADSITPNATASSAISLTNYSASEGGPDFLSTPLTATATASTAAVALAKAITATNQTFTTGTNLAVGEVATYTVTLTLPEGVTPSARLVDTLPAGLAIVGVDSITPSSGAVTSSHGSWATVLGSYVTIGSGGSSATFDLGDVTDADRDNSTAETLTIVYRVVATNVAGNTQGRTLTNSAALTYTGGSAAASATATVLVPKLTLAASADKSTVQAGDTVTYTFTVSNLAASGSGTDAYDVALTDALPAGLTLVAGSLTNTAGTTPTSTSAAGNTVTINFDRLALGASSTFTVRATVDGTTGPYQTFTDPFGLTYTTLPGAVTTAQSSYSTVSTERTGSTSDPGGSTNNLTASRSVTVATAPPAAAKLIVGTNLATTSGTNVAVGEEVQYRVTLTIPDGVSANAVLTDTLPAGLALVSVDSITASPALSTSVAGGFAAVASSATVGSGGGSLGLNFGTITNSDLDSTQAETIVVTYTAVVLNTAANVAGTSLQNSVQFAVQGGSVAASAPAVRVVLPVLKVTVTPDKPTAQAGDTVTYTVVVANLAANGSAADAYDVNLADLLPSGLTYVAGSFANTAGVAPTSTSTAGPAPSATFADLALGGSSTFTLQATVDSSTGPYQSFTNTATANYTTLPGAVTAAQSSYNALSTERTGSTSDPGGSANNLTTSGSAPIATVLPNLGKVVVGTSLATTAGANVAVGEKVQYQVTITVPDGVTTNATLVDTLPAGLAIVSVDSLTYSPTLSSSQPGGFAGVQAAATVGTNGSSLALNFGTITNSNRDTTQTQTIVVTYTAVVLNSATNTAGRVLTNSAVFAVQGGSTTATTPVTVVEPHVGVTISSTPTRGDANGPAITFTVVVAATAGTGADAYDVNLSDILPAGFTYVASSLTSTAGTAPTTLSDASGQVLVTYADLAPGATSTLTFQATLNGTTSPGQVVADTAGLTYTSLPGDVTTAQSTYNASSTERTGKTTDPGGSANTYAAGGSTSVTVNANTIAGTVFDDRNDDGAIGAGEPGLAGATVTLTGVDNLGNAVNQSVTSTASGAFSFTLLRPGSYNLAMTPPAGYLDGIDTVGTPFGGTVSAPDHITGLTIPLGTNAAGAGYNLAELRPASVAGKVFVDLNNNRAVDASESGIAGVALTLTGTDDLGHSVNTTLTTDSNGNFSFANLRPGTYAVAESQPGGYLQGKNSAGTAGGTFAVDALSGVVLVEGQAVAGITFGELPPATLAGTVYVDANDDAVKQAGETGVGNVAVTLTGVDDLGNAVNTTVATAGGSYSFAGLRPGTYAVAAATPAGFVAGKATAGTLGGSVPSRDRVAGIAVAAGNAGAGYDLGLLPPSSVAGSVFVDANNDGTRGSGESGVGSATITLTGTDDLGNAVTLTTTTLGDGSYSFTNLEPGTYAVAATVPAGDLGGKAAAGSLGGNATAPDQVTAIPVTPGAAGAGYTLGVLLPSSLAGYVYSDANDDGVKSGSEAGIGGVAVTLTGTDDRGAAVSRTTTTAGDGSYSFGTLRPGTYALAAATPGGYLVGKVAPGTAGGTAGSGTLTAIALPQGTAAAANNFGELAPAGLAGVVFADANNDGIQQVGDAGIAGVVITLTGVNDLGNAVNTTATTAATGTYSFAGLRPGTYKLTEAPPVGRLDGKVAVGSLGGSAGVESVAAIAVAPGAAGSGYDFARLDPATLAGTVFRDDSNDGSQQGGEPGIAGVALTLTGTDDLGNSVSRTTTTGGDGTYAFAGLRPGTYAVAITPPAGYLDGIESPGSAGGTVGIHQIGGATLAPAGVGSGYNFAELAPSSLAGAVFRDDSNDGVEQAGEPGLAGLTVTLTGTDDLGNSVSLATTTAGDGTFAFAGLRPSDASGYAVTSTTPAGYLAGRVVAGSLGGTVAGRQVGGIVLASNTAATGYTFADLTPSTLAGLVFLDPNNNGIPEAGEPGLGGASLTLTGTDDLGDAVRSVVATTDGTYAFAGLRPGTYAIALTPPAGYLDGADTAGTLGGSAATPDQITSIVVPSRAAGTGYDFGELLPGTLAGVVYFDANEDGTRGAGEPGRAGATITLTGTDDHGAAVTASVTSAADGTYFFTGLRPGTYALTEVPPGGELDGHANPGSRGGTAAGARSIGGIVLGADQAATAYNFGVLDPATVAGSVYVDANDDGARQPGEAGLGGVTLTLTGIDDLGAAVSANATTLADGTYSFPGLRPGSYTVAESAPAGYLDGRVTPGPAGGAAGARQVSGISPAPGASAGGNLFAALRPASLAGSVYLDRNDDGTPQAGEPGLDGVLVTLTGTDDRGASVSQTVTTAGGGLYSFAGLRPGSYHLSETPPAGTLAGIDAAGSLGGTVVGDAIAVDVAEGDAGAGYTFARLAPAGIAGVVFADGNDDGIQGASDPGLAGATLVLTGTDDRGQAVSATVATNPDGSYAFAGLRPGTYAISIAPPAGYLDGTETPGTAGGSAGPRRIGTIVLTSGTAATGYAFAELVPSSLAGVAYDDANDDGVQGPGEGGLAGVTITLTGTDDRGVGVSQVTSTASDGTYRFDSLRPGSYALTAASPAGTLDGRSTVGTQGGTAGGRSIAVPGLGQGVAGAGNDFASLAPAALAGLVYLDRNADGLLEAGEPGIAGVSVALTGTDDLGHAVSTAQVTAADGSYRFATLRPGTYTLTETPPAADFDGRVAAGSAGGTVGTHRVAAIPLNPGTIGTGYTFGHVPGARLAGFVFDDASDDGKKGPSEAGLGGVVVTLTGTDAQGQPVTRTATTAPDGSYSFDGLHPGTYGLAAAPPAGYLAGKTSGAGCSCSCPDGLGSIPVVAGDSFAGELIGMVRPAMLAGSVYFDSNRDAARQAGERGQAGITVTLDGIDDLGAAVSRTTTTDAAGHYAFAGLRPGRYALADLRPSTYAGESAAAGTLGGTAGTDVVLGVAPGSGATGLGYDFALVGSTIGGRVEVVAGVGGATGVGGVTITLADAHGVPLASTTTAADGSYQFADLPTGAYLLGMTTPAGLAAATPTVRSVALPLGGIGGQDFGLAAASIAGVVFADANDDGIQQPGEAGLANVVVTLAGRDFAGRPVQATTRTLGDGSYAFLGLAAGTYGVSGPPVPGYLDGRSAAGNLGGAAGPDLVTAITVGGGAIGAGYRFGKLFPARVAGVAYLDLDHDGRRGATEPGVAGTVVELTGTDDFGAAVDRSLATGPDGSYVFDDLLPGTYALTATPPAGYAPGPIAAGGQITLVAGGSATTDAAAEGSDLTGLVLDDQGVGPAPGALVRLLDAGGRVVATTATGPDGLYRLPWLVAGAYTVEVARPNADGTVSTLDRAVDLPPGAAADASFTAVPPPVPTGLIAGTVFLDRDDDGGRGPGEAGLAGLAVTLTGTDATGRAVALTTTTDALGNYAFAGQLAGSYAVTVTPPAGYLVDRASPTTQAVELPAGGIAAPSFGLLPPGGLAGAVYLDANRSGSFGATDFGVANVTITLTGTDDLGHAVTATTITDDDGRYAFAGLRPGIYAVARGGTMAALADGPSNPGSLGGVAGANLVGRVVLLGGDLGSSYNFAQRIKPGCVLAQPQVRAMIAQGPHPTGPVTAATLRATHEARAKLSHASHLKVARYLPRLAARLGIRKP